MVEEYESSNVALTTFRTSEELKERIECAASKQGLSTSEYVRGVLSVHTPNDTTNEAEAIINAIKYHINRLETHIKEAKNDVRQGENKDISNGNQGNEKQLPESDTNETRYDQTPRLHSRWS
jgi:predicted DNA-binding protein